LIRDFDSHTSALIITNHLLPISLASLIVNIRIEKLFFPNKKYMWIKTFILPITIFAIFAIVSTVLTVYMTEYYDRNLPTFQFFYFLIMYLSVVYIPIKNLVSNYKLEKKLNS
jgi:small basic protein